MLRNLSRFFSDTKVSNGRKAGLAVMLTFLAASLTFLYMPHAACASGTETLETQNIQEVPDNNGDPGGFLREPSSFSSYIEYYNYCKEMYNAGYMNADFSWTPEAYAYAMSPTDENYEKLQESLKKNREKADDEGESTKPSENTGGNEEGTAPSDTNVKMTERETEKEVKMSPESAKVNSMLRAIIIMVVLIAIVIFMSFYTKAKKRKN